MAGTHLSFVFATMAGACQSQTNLKHPLPEAEPRLETSPQRTDRAPAPTPKTGISLESASESACAFGGLLVITYLDSNDNGQLDPGEARLSSAAVCNGANGATGETGERGLSTGLSVVSAPASACPAGGLEITSFIDADSDGARADTERVTSVSYVCNGIAGIKGADGENGKDGEATRLTLSPATPEQCPAGGSVFSVFFGTDSLPETSVICNGVNGADGKNGSSKAPTYSMGAVGPEVPKKAFTACHHDYLYLPGPSPKDRGWLLFRHQGNGSFDQGIGSSGFQVWNVDLARFSLVSEVGGIEYCRMNWNSAEAELEFEVIDDRFGQAGRKGTIRL